MTEPSERQLERSERAVVLERDCAVGRIRTALAIEGSAECEDCGDAIGADRRAAMPSARTCIGCQSLRERRIAVSRSVEEGR